LVRFPAIVIGCIISLRHVRAAFDNINARGGTAGYRFGRMALDGEVLMPGERRRGRVWVHGWWNHGLVSYRAEISLKMLL